MLKTLQDAALQDAALQDAASRCWVSVPAGRGSKFEAVVQGSDVGGILNRNESAGDRFEPMREFNFSMCPRKIGANISPVKIVPLKDLKFWFSVFGFRSLGKIAN